MDEEAITRHIAETFAGVRVTIASAQNGAPEIAWGDRFFIYDPDGDLPPERHFPFATIVIKDYGDFDRASNLDRPGVFRLNIGLGKEAYRAHFGAPPKPAGAGGAVDTGHDFTALDVVMPHPVYAPQSWVCILNPGEATFRAEVQSLLADAYQTAAGRFGRRTRGE
ncbi:MAG TPA: DUF6194 family protein [Longimicrobium sp.]|nr:DUF6194 family protein [Longimicrobium sp.]